MIGFIIGYIIGFIIWIVVDKFLRRKINE